MQVEYNSKMIEQQKEMDSLREYVRENSRKIANERNDEQKEYKSRIKDFEEKIKDFEWETEKELKARNKLIRNLISRVKESEAVSKIDIEESCINLPSEVLECKDCYLKDDKVISLNKRVDDLNKYIKQSKR